MTFTWTPDYSAQKSVEPLVKRIQFGDGYEHRQANGINTQPQKWSLQFENRDQTDSDDIDAFLSARGALESFDWTTPDGNALKFVCRSWNKTITHAGTYTITALFEEVFEP